MKNDYLYTKVYDSINDFSLDDNSVYFYGYSPEDRSHFIDQLIPQSQNVFFIRLEEVDREKIRDTSDLQEYFLRSTANIKELLLKKPCKTMYIDVTGLDNRICASLIKNAVECSRNGTVDDIKIIYVEPAFYKIRQFKAESVFHDLSDKIEGIAPLPGFASIFPEDDQDIFLVALLGFEGGRFIHLLENVQPPRTNVIPIIGVPGFRLEYPYIAYWGNRRPLEETETWRNVKFAAANSLVEAYMELTKIAKKNPGFKLKLAPIGTKPHAIGAMLFAIKYPRNVELVYDNPKRKAQRTEGVSTIIESLVTKLITEN